MTKSCCASNRQADPDLPQPPAQAHQAGGPAPTDVVWLDGGKSWCGASSVGIAGDGEERRETRLKPFGIARYAVTNREFAAFIAATGYVTDADRYGWSFVFKDALTQDQQRATSRVVEAPWWHNVPEASWRRPAGPGSTIDGIEDHPVVHVSWNDAAAYAAWAGGRLLSEAEWEFAARGGRDVVYPWGDADSADDAPRCNIWQGFFPRLNLAVDGFETTAPVDSFEPNGYGLHNMAGNTWEWCHEAFRVRSLSAQSKARDQQARAEKERTLKGGSFLCHRDYCHRYRIAARMGRSPDTSTSHIGFRLGYDRSVN